MKKGSAARPRRPGDPDEERGAGPAAVERDYLAGTPTDGTSTSSSGRWSLLRNRPRTSAFAVSFPHAAIDASIAPLANKADLRDGASVKESEVAGAAERYGDTYFLTSARSGENVERAFQDRVERIAAPPRSFPGVAK